MDGTLLNGRTIFSFAERFGFLEDLTILLDSDDEPYIKSLKIARLLKGRTKDELLSVFRKIPLRLHTQEVIDELKKSGMNVFIATDSYDIVAQDIQKRLGIRDIFANTLMIEKGSVTGELILHNKDHVFDDVTKRVYSICKGCIVEKLAKTYRVSLDDIIAVGDGIVDCSMIKKAGLGIAIDASDEVNNHADVIIKDLQTILSYV